MSESKPSRLILVAILGALVLAAIVMMSLFSAEPDTRADTIGLEDVDTNAYDGVEGE